MLYSDFENFFINKCKNNNIKIPNDLKNFFEYMNQIIEWNKKINLTTIINEEDFIIKHYIDSLTVIDFIGPEDHVIDIGTGAGFPGMPIKMFHKEQKVTLVDSVGKKLNVIKDISKKLNIIDLEIIHSRAEDLAQNKEYREKYDVAVSRAVSNMTTLVEYLLPFVKIGGKVLCMKGPNLEEELNQSKHAIEILGGKIIEVKKIILDKEHERSIVIIEKTKSTPKQYPRPQNKPLKDPLK